MKLEELIENCHILDKKAGELYLRSMENTDPVLSELSSIKDYNKRIKFAKDKFKQLGEGSSRVAFEMPEQKVLKVAKNEKGEAQNKEETKPSMQAAITNRVLFADPEGKWIIVAFAKKITNKRFEELTSLSFKAFGDALLYKFNNEADEFKKPKDYDQIVETKLFCEVAKLIFENDLQIGDLLKINSWAEVNEKPVLADFGLTRDIYDEYYAD